MMSTVTVLVRRLNVVGLSLGMLTMLLWSPVTRAQKKYPVAFPRDGAIKLQETDLIAFWEVEHAKGQASPMYELALDQLTITLTDGAVKFTRPDGTSRIDQERLGGVRFESKGTVVQEVGLTDIPSREIVAQLKDVQPPHWPVTPGIPGQFPRLDAVKLFENSRVTVWDQTWLPNRPVTNHLHYTPTAAVFLSAGRFRTRDVGKPPGNPAERYIGFVLPQASQISVPHEEEWVSGEPRAIWIEFK